MPFTPISEADLQSFKNNLSESEKSAAELFSTLKNLKKGFKNNEDELINLKYFSAKRRLENDYLLKKEHWDAEIQDLKKQFKQLDNRIIAAEQKLKNGIPEDLQIMEKLITEQESIVADQEKLNTIELELIAHVRNIDIEYGKEQEKLSQLNTSSYSNNDNKIIDNESPLDKVEKNIKLKVNLISLIPILIIPFLADLLGKSIGLQQAGKTEHLITGHYFFFITLILTEIFLVDKIRTRISRLLAVQYLKTSFSELQLSFNKNNAELNSLKQKSN